MENPILVRAYNAWSSAADFRSRRERYKRFTYGDQWCDAVPDGHGALITERESIERSGKRPYTNNLIRRLVKSVVGRYRTDAAEKGLYGGDIADAAARNALAELDARLLEEFLISGCAVQRIVDERRWGGRGVWVDNVDPRRFFVNKFHDPRGWDVDMAGMLHDMTFAELVNRFGMGDRRRVEKIRRLYDSNSGDRAYAGATALGTAETMNDFFIADSPDRLRVIEVWTFDSRPAPRGASLRFAWHCRMFAPDGTVLAEYDSPCRHGAHPFAIKFYPLTDGEVHSFVEDVLDQQKFINRLIVTLDHIVACSAKGVLLFPVDQLPKNVSWNDVAATWAQADGIIPVTGRGTTMPQQVNSGGANSGAYQLLQLQMRLFEEVSGVGDALMGRSDGSARGAEMLDAQVRNATIALADLFESFSAFAAARNDKVLTT